MPIEYVAGDLFANTFAVAAFAHGCNCQGSMGAGIAVAFRQRYPEMYAQYRGMCKSSPRAFNPGDVFLYKAEDQPWVFNLATQEHYRHSRATLDAIRTCLLRMRALADAEGVASIGMPRIGAGHGGLPWPRVRVVVEETLADWAGRLVVYEEYVAE